MPQGLIQLDELPKYAGLYWFKDGELHELKRPSKITDYQHDLNKIKDKLLRVMSERMFYGCARLTKKNREAKERYESFKNQTENSLF